MTLTTFFIVYLYIIGCHQIYTTLKLRRDRNRASLLFMCAATGQTPPRERSTNTLVAISSLFYPITYLIALIIAKK